MSFEYKMVQIPPNISIGKRQKSGDDAAQYLQSVVNEYAQLGWEFYRIDELGVHSSPGCLAALLGQKAQVTQYYVVSFRRQAA